MTKGLPHAKGGKLAGETWATRALHSSMTQIIDYALSMGSQGPEISEQRLSAEIKPECRSP